MNADSPPPGSSQGPPSLSIIQVQQQVSRNALVSVLSQGFYLLSRFFLPAFTLSYISLDAYGIWAICFIITNYISMLGNIGISNVYIRFVASYYAQGELQRISSLLSTGLSIITLVSLLLLGGITLLLPAIIDFFRIPLPLHDTARILILGTAILFCVELTLGSFQQVLKGLQRLTSTVYIWNAGVLVETLLILALLPLGSGVLGLLWAYAVRCLVSGLLGMVVCYRTLPTLSLGWRHWDRSYLRLFYGYGALLQLSGITGTLARSLGKLTVGATVGVHATGLLDLGEKIPRMMATVPGAINNAFLPAMSFMQGQQAKSEAMTLYLRGTRYSHLITGTPMGFLAAFSPFLVQGWLGDNPDYATTPLLLTLLTLPFHLHVTTGPCSALLRSLNQPLRELLYPVSQLLTNLLAIGVTLFLVGPDTVAIVAAVSLAWTLCSLWYMQRINRYLALPLSHFVVHILLPGLIPYGVGFGLAGAIHWLIAPTPANRLDALLIILLAGMVYSLLLAVVLWFSVLDNGERTALGRRIHSLSDRFFTS